MVRRVIRGGSIVQQRGRGYSRCTVATVVLGVVMLLYTVAFIYLQSSSPSTTTTDTDTVKTPVETPRPPLRIKPISRFEPTAYPPPDPAQQKPPHTDPPKPRPKAEEVQKPQETFATAKASALPVDGPTNLNTRRERLQAPEVTPPKNTEGTEHETTPSSPAEDTPENDVEETTPNTLNQPDYTAIDPSIKCDVVDVVYTWVNGSDPEHTKLRKQYGSNWDGGYREYGVLKYSMRSIDKFMPWVRDIILVTNGQIPTWADPNAPGFRLVTHDQIFKNKDDLPTFSSNAIEANLHNIPGLAPCLLYLNDDMFLGRPIPQDFYFNPDTGKLNLFMSKTMAPNAEKMQKNLWHASVGFSNSLLNKWYNPEEEDKEHNYVSHFCYFMRQDVLDVMYHRWSEDFDRTSKTKFRARTDTALPFLAANVALAENVAITGKARNTYGTWKPDAEENSKWWADTWKESPYCICINDGLDNTPASLVQTERLTELLEERYPLPSRAER
ncbi:sugar phosphotransferase [Pelomyxa schiedti]|nr:sugar phosphotransferase [Pelomyxa schiedti]